MFKFINGRLSISVRLALAAGLFIIASAVSAIIQVDRAMENIDFSKKELLGAEYIQNIWQSLQTGRANAMADHAKYDAAFRSDQMEG